ncbi:MAG: helix-turn-helix domain-containing protein [Pseudomonadota bacterium]
MHVPNSIAIIKRVVAIYFDIKVAQIDSRKRTADAVLPRHLAIFLANKLTNNSLNMIARHFAGRDRSTIKNAIRRMTERIAREPDLRNLTEKLESRAAQCLEEERMMMLKRVEHL